MINLKKAFALAAVGVMTAASAAFAGTPGNDVVKDTGGHIVVSTNGNCVITKWTNDHDECIGGIDIRSRLSKEQRTVYFDFNKSTLNAAEKAKLTEVSKIMIASKQVESVDIVGFADSIGNDGYNKVLSKRRANTVKAFLASKGLRTRKVRVEAMGESKPVTDCDPDLERSELIACLAADRRVEIEINVRK